MQVRLKPLFILVFINASTRMFDSGNVCWWSTGHSAACNDSVWLSKRSIVNGTPEKCLNWADWTYIVANALCFMCVVILLLWFLICRLLYGKINSGLLSTKQNKTRVFCWINGDQEEMTDLGNNVFLCDSTRLPENLYLSIKRSSAEPTSKISSIEISSIHKNWQYKIKRYFIVKVRTFTINLSHSSTKILSSMAKWNLLLNFLAIMKPLKLTKKVGTNVVEATWNYLARWFYFQSLVLLLA